VFLDLLQYVSTSGSTANLSGVICIAKPRLYQVKDSNVRIAHLMFDDVTHRAHRALDSLSDVTACAELDAQMRRRTPFSFFSEFE